MSKQAATVFTLNLILENFHAHIFPCVARNRPKDPWEGGSGASPPVCPTSLLILHGVNLFVCC